MRVEWKTVSLIIFAYGAWALAGFWLWDFAPVPALVVMAVLAALHSSLVHECIHGHPTRMRWLNEALVTANLSLVWPYRRFRTMHLRHHHDAHLTDPFEDPESYYKAKWQLQSWPAWFQMILKINNTMLGRIIVGPVLGLCGLVAGDAREILRGNRAILWQWILHIATTAPIVFAVVSLFEIPFWIYVVGVVWPALGLISIRTYAEHRWFEAVDGRTIIVEKTPLSLLFLNNNLHIVHHTHPAAPWYELPALFKESRDDWVQRNHGYVYRNYAELFREFSFRQKETIAHPVLHTEPERQPSRSMV